MREVEGTKIECQLLKRDESRGKVKRRIKIKTINVKMKEKT